MQYKNQRTAYIVLFVFAALLYANTVPNRYALDDKMLIYNNDFTLKGFDGIWDILTKDSMAGMFGEESHAVAGGRYRPISIVTFALEQELFGGNPHISHFINLLLYALSVVLLYKLLLRLFQSKESKKWWWTVPFITSLLFAVHPLHTDAVANIKGRDEILCFLFCIAAMLHVIKYFDNKKKIQLLYVLLWYLLAVFTKELAITFLFVIPISIYFFRDYKLKSYLPFVFVLFAGAIVYLLVRASVVGNALGDASNGLMNNPFAEANTSQRYGTVFFTLLIYLKLLFVPHPLTWDYYPYHIPLVDILNFRAILSLILYLAMGVYAILGIRKKSIYSWGILIYLATLSITSNLFFTVGAFMSERFLFISLLGFCVILAHVIVKVLTPKMNKTLLMGGLGIIILLFSVKTITRNTNWKDNITLFAHDVKVSKNSAKGNSSYASELYSLAEPMTDTAQRNKILRQSIPYFERAAEIYPSYTESLIRLGNVYYMMNGDYKTMLAYYLKALKANPKEKDVWGNTIGVLEKNVQDIPFELYIWKEYRKLNPNMYEAWFYAGRLYRQYTQVQDSAVLLLEQANVLRANDVQILKELGIAYGNLGDFEQAKSYLLQAEKLGTSDAEIIRFIGVIYGMEGNDKLALEYFEKALEINPNNTMYQQDIIVAKKRLEI